KSDIESFAKNSEDTGQNRANRTAFVHGLSINEGELEKLIYSSSAGIISDEELKKYINYDKIKEETNSEEGARAVYNNSIKVLRDKVSTMGANLKQTVERGDVLYNDNYKAVILPDNLSAKEKQNHPIAGLQGHLNEWKEKDPQYYDKLIDVNTGLPIANLIKEKEGDDMEIDFKGAKIMPLVDKVPDANGGYATGIIIDVPIGEDSKNMQSKRYIVKSSDEGFNQSAEIRYNDYRKLLLAKPNLNSSDIAALSNVNLSLFNGTKEGQQMDYLNLSDMSNRETVNIMLPNRIPATIQAFKTESPQNKAYYLVQKEGNEVKYWAENNQGQRVLLSEAELGATSEYKALGGNSIKDLKTKIANTLYNSGVLDNN
ncbi:hypothetical protein GW934_01280, partial [Candidatus Falkowbacteria bacterium]|nr:hypothetical protein [Candidatus Falkowbacteria bacterium]